MEVEQFDAFTRRLSGAGSSRRQVMQALAGVFFGGLLHGIAARLSLVEVSAATSKKHRAKPKQRRKPQAERQVRGQLQAEGKRKGNRRNKKPKNRPPPDPVCDNGKPKCPDGSCVPFGECCPGYYRCDDGFCVKDDACCPGQWTCADGSCIPQEECCPDEFPCRDGSCVSQGACCPGEKLCPGIPGWGGCVAENTCCPNAVPPVCDACQEVACENGELVCRGECQCEEVCEPQSGLCSSPGCGPTERCVEGDCRVTCLTGDEVCVVLEDSGVVRWGCCTPPSRCHKSRWGFAHCCVDPYCDGH